MRKFALAVICTFVLVGYVMADEFLATISKVDGNTVTYKKGFGGGKKKDGAEPAKDEKADATADVKVAKGEIDFGAGGFGKKGGGTDKGAGKGTGKGAGKGAGGGINVKAGDPIVKGLRDEMFSKIDEKGITAQITTNDAGKITQILTVEFGGGKGFGTGKGGFGTGKGAGKKGGFGKGTEKE